MNKIRNAVDWAVGIAGDDSHGYSQDYRWGPDYDCSSLVISAWEQAGVLVKTNGASYTGDMVNVFLSCGFTDVTSSIDLVTGSGIVYGDVLWKSGHTEMCCGDLTLVGASANENGEATGGQEGDQTGNEIRVRSYYNAPWTVVLRYNYSQPATWISKNAYLSVAEQQNNAKIVHRFFISHGWSVNAVAAILANMEVESTINPGIWESLTTDPEAYYNENERYPGYGIVQWTPYTKYTEWCGTDWDTNHDKQLERIIWEMENGVQYYPTDNYPETFEEFSTSTKSAYYLAGAFLYNYERPKKPNAADRGERAEKWLDFLKTLPGVYSQIPVWLLFKLKRRHL